MADMDSSEPAAPDALTLLTADHDKVVKMYKEFQRLEKKEDDSGRIGEIVKEVCNDLTIHAKIEEEIFYPALRERIPDDMLNEAKIEHASIKDLISQLTLSSAADVLYNAKFTVLCEYVAHHVEEEQNEMFRQVKKAKIDVKALGSQLFARKEELRAELGLPPSPPPPATRKAKPPVKKAAAKKGSKTAAKKGSKTAAKKR